MLLKLYKHRLKSINFLLLSLFVPSFVLSETLQNGKNADWSIASIQASVTIVLTSNNNPSLFGQSVTFKATVDDSSGTPTGSVTFYDEASLLGTVALTGDSAVVSTSGLTAGVHTIKAVYSDDNNFNSDSTTISQTVNQADATISLTSSNNPSLFEQMITFKATVDDSTSLPTGSVTFYDGANLLEIVSLHRDSAEVSTSSLTAGSHTIKSVYSGDSNFKSDSAIISQTVNQISPTITLTSDNNPSIFEQNVTLKAKVDNSTTTPTGNVTFYDGANSLGTVSLTGDSVQISTANLTAGSHTIKAVYSGDVNFNSDSTTITQTVNQSGPTVTLTSNNNPSTFEQNVTFKAKVDNSSHTPTGSVTFYDGSNSLGTVSLTGDSAQVNTANLIAGSHSIKAVYGGDTNFKSDSATITQTVNQSGPTVTLTSSNNPSTFEQNITFKAKVDNSSHTPTGSVTFYDGTNSLGTVSLSGDSGEVSTANLSAGSHSIKAVYGGDANFKSDSTTITQTVNQSGPMVTLTSNNNPSAFEQNVTFKAKVDNSSHIPTGSVTFYDGTNSLGTISLVGDSAQVSTATLSAGNHSIKAVYSGDSNFKSDSTTITQTVNQAGITVTLTSNNNPSTFEQNITFKAKVDNSSHTPTGSVTFYDGTNSLGTVSLSGDSGEVSTANLSAGSHSIKAVYGGDANFKSDSTTITQTVNQAGPAVTLTSSGNPSTFEQNVTFKAKVDNSSQTPTGSVTFYDGSNSLGTVSLTGDSAQVSTANLAAGSHTIKAVYGGDSNFNSDSTTITQTVNQSGPTVTLTSNNNPSTFEQNITFKAKVDNSSHTPTGSVTFYDGTNSLGTVSLVGDSAQVSTANLTAGSHSIKAVYSGDTNFKSDSTTITQTVNQSGPTVTLTSNNNPSTFEQNVTFKAKVDNSSHIPTGSVTFYDGTNSLGTISLVGDSAQVSTATLSAGNHSIKAVYSGDGNFRSDSATITQTVNQATPTIALTSSGNPSTFEQSVTFKAKVDNSSHTPTGSVTFYDGSNSLGTISLVGDSAQVSTAALSAGSHSMKAVYSGDSNFKSDSTTISQTVNQSNITITLTSSSNPSTFEQNVTFKAKVDGIATQPTGSVTFYDGTNSLGTISLVGDSAQVSTPNLTAGSHSIKAVYGGDSNFKSDSTTITQTVNQAGPTVTLTSSNNPSTFEQNVTFKAKVDNGSTQPTGSVTFYDGTNSLGTISLVGDSAQISTATLSAGSHSVKAVYGGNSNFKSDSTTITQTVNQAVPTITLTSSGSPSSFGLSVTFKAKVDNSSHTPTGSVTFYDGTNSLGTISLTGDSAQVSTAGLAVGSHTIKAIYDGDSNFKTDSTTITQTVNQASTIMSLMSSGNPSTYLQSITFKAKVDNGSTQPTGSVTFYDGAISLGTIPLTGDSAQVNISGLTAGTHTIKAVYGGDVNFTADSMTIIQTVHKKPTTGLLTSSANPSSVGQSITLKDSVSSSGSVPNGGKVYFKVDGTVVDSANINGSGVATVSRSTLTAGTHVLAGSYGGASNFDTSSSNTVNQTVNQLTITATAGANGTINPSGTVNVSYGTNQACMMTPNTGYHVDTLFVDGIKVDSTTSYTFINVTANHTIRAVFAINQYTITASAGSNGTINPNGAVIVNYGNNRAFTVTPNTGYHVDTLFVDGIKVDSTTSYTFINVTTNHTIRAVFAITQYTITASAGSNGTINPNGAVIVNYGSNRAFTITPNTGYHVDTLLVDGVKVDSMTSYTFINVTASHTIRAVFALNHYIITASAGPNGTIAPSGSIIVAYGANQGFTITPNTGYKVDTLFIDGVKVDSTTSYTFKNVTANHTIRVVFTIIKYTITASTKPHGSIAPSGNVLVNYGGSQTFTITPNTGYHVDTLVVDGMPVDSTASYTFTNVLANHTIRAVFAIDQFTVVASAGPNGSISPSGNISVNYGATQTFVIVGDPNYRVSDVLVDGNSVGNVISYSFIDVTTNHTISATFEPSTAYAKFYRSFRQDSLSLDRDNKGRIGRFVQRKPDKVQFKFTVKALQTAPITLRFSMPVIAVVTDPTKTIILDSINNVKIFTTSAPVQIGTSIQVEGMGTIGKKLKTTYAILTSPPIRGIVPDQNYIINQPQLPMPNRVNVLQEAFAFSGFVPTNGLLVGKVRTDSAKIYGWLQSPRYTDVLKSLLDTSGIHTGTPRGFDKDTHGIPVIGLKKQLPPSKFNDVLLADMIALKLNIVASMLQKTPLGFGELIYFDGTNSLNGLMVKEIAQLGDSLMMGYYDSRYFRVHTIFDPEVYVNLDTVIQKINAAFEGPMDTVKFSDTLITKGVRALVDVPFLRSNAAVVPAQIKPVQILSLDLPSRFELYQNFPNPFNPVTTIQFNLSEPASVTLKVYNMLGQEVQSIYDQAQFDDGVQEITFDGSNLASGVYFYRLIAEGAPSEDTPDKPGSYTVITKKMLLLK